jgi:hypothetical protein
MPVTSYLDSAVPVFLLFSYVCVCAGLLDAAIFEYNLTLAIPTTTPIYSKQYAIEAHSLLGVYQQTTTLCSNMSYMDF